MSAPIPPRGRFAEPRAIDETRLGGQVLFEFERGADRVRGELRSHDLWGTEAQIFVNEALVRRGRFFTRELAEQWARQQRATFVPLA